MALLLLLYYAACLVSRATAQYNHNFQSTRVIDPLRPGTLYDGFK